MNIRRISLSIWPLAHNATVRCSQGSSFYHHTRGPLYILTSETKLFQPLQIGALTLQHRIVLAPLTRFRANAAHEPQDVTVAYYAQRAGVPGTLLISEPKFVAPEAGGYDNVPGVWSDAQIAQWKKVADAVHAKGSFIFMQLWALGRAADPATLARSGFPLISSSNIPLHPSPAPPPRPLSLPEIATYIDHFATAAKNAVERAGFDGVELHGAHGFLIDQFLQPSINDRTDEYGGSEEGRLRFALEVVRAVVQAVGEEKVGLRISPWSPFNVPDRMPDPMPTFTALVARLRDAHPGLAYLHVVEPRMNGEEYQPVTTESNDALRRIWAPRPYVAAGGFDRAEAVRAAEAEGEGVLVAFGRYFISNPDLPRRLKNDWPLAKYDRSTFYTHGPEAVEGYIDYPAYAEA